MSTIRSISGAFWLVPFACLAPVVTWCVVSDPTPAFGEPPSARGKKSGQNVDVVVSFYDHEFDGVQSDGKDYLKTRKNRVKAHIEENGQFHLHTWDSRERSIHMLFPEPAPDNCFPVFEELDPYVHANLDTLGIDLLAMEPGDVMGNEETESVQVRITFPDLVNNHWYLIFNVVVARTDDMTWEIVTDGVASLRDPEGPTQGTLDCGFVDMPFGITITTLVE